MNSQEFDRALTNISDPLIDSAARAYDRGKRRPGYKKYLRIAAAAAAVVILLTALSFWHAGTDFFGKGIVAVPGVMRVYACEPEESEGSSLEAYELTDGIDSYNRVWVPGVSGLQTGYGIPLTFQLDPQYYGEADLSLHLSVDFGVFFCTDAVDDVNQEITVKNGQTAVWLGRQWYDASELIDPSGKYYGYILIYADETLVGYGVIDFIYQHKEGHLPSFSATNFSTYCFPLIDGEYQDVSEEYVWEQIEQLKK